MALVPPNGDSSMGWICKNARMAIEATHHVKALSNFSEYELGHLYVCRMTVLPIIVQSVEINCGRIELFNVDLCCWVCDAIEELVRSLNMRYGF